jgi:hypothetical protein
LSKYAIEGYRFLEKKENDRTTSKLDHLAILGFLHICLDRIPFVELPKLTTSRPEVRHGPCFDPEHVVHDIRRLGPAQFYDHHLVVAGEPLEDLVELAKVAASAAVVLVQVYDVGEDVVGKEKGKIDVGSDGSRYRNPVL